MLHISYNKWKVKKAPHLYNRVCPSVLLVGPSVTLTKIKLFQQIIGLSMRTHCRPYKPCLNGCPFKSWYRALNQFEMATGIFWMTRPTKQSLVTTLMFFLRFRWNLVCGQILGKRQYRISLKWVRLFFWLTTTNTVIIVWVLSHFESIQIGLNDFVKFSM